MAPAENAPCVSFQEIPIADLADRRGAAVGLERRRWVNLLGGRDQLLTGDDPRLLDSYQPVMPDDLAPVPSLQGLVPEDEALRPPGLARTPKPLSSPSHRNRSELLTREGFNASTTRFVSFSVTKE
jgi:hypothetical protein